MEDYSRKKERESSRENECKWARFRRVLLAMMIKTFIAIFRLNSAPAQARVNFDEQKKSRCERFEPKAKKKTLLSLLSFFFPSPLFLPSLDSRR